MVELTAYPAAIRAFVEATNAADPDAFVTALTHDAHLDDRGRTFTGRTGVTAWDRTDDIGVHAHFDLLSVTKTDEPDTHVATLRVTGSGYNGTGPTTFRLRDGLIADLRIA
ncbi:nuclear transport factor 2 family protein [Streptosporangium sandarakinum]|uniref:nuclear transport factor 2 family protein n=1 Tax=Streptosporangium TaxID=2000 RepID=UPI0031F87CC4